MQVKKLKRGGVRQSDYIQEFSDKVLVSICQRTWQRDVQQGDADTTPIPYI